MDWQTDCIESTALDVPRAYLSRAKESQGRIPNAGLVGVRYSDGVCHWMVRCVNRYRLQLITRGSTGSFLISSPVRNRLRFSCNST